MNTSVESLTHKMQRAAVGKMVDVVLSHADKDRQKTVGQLVDVAKQFYGSSFSAEAYEHARQTLTDPDSKWSKLINCVLDQTDPNVARTMALNLGYEAAGPVNTVTRITSALRIWTRSLPRARSWACTCTC